MHFRVNHILLSVLLSVTKLDRERERHACTDRWPLQQYIWVGENVWLPFGHSTLSTRSHSPRPTTSGRPWGGHIYGRAGSPQSTTAHINRCSVVGPVGAGATLALVVYISRMGLHESGLGGPSGSRHTLTRTQTHTLMEGRSRVQTNNTPTHTHTS